MKKSAVILFIIFAVISCTKDKTPSVTPKLKNCRIEYLFFKDEITILSYQSINFAPYDSTVIACSYSYADDKLTRTTGGFVAVPSGSNFSNFLFSTDAYDSIHFDNNTIYTYAKINFGKYIYTDISSPTTFTLDSQNKLIKISKKDAFDPYGLVLNYSYSENLVTETDNNGLTRRKFYLENNNLVKVVTEVYDLQGALYSKKEILFEGFDNKPNPFKNMYYVTGAFFRAFSENNYQKVTVTEYSFLLDGTFGINSTWWFTMPFDYNADGYPKFGDYE